MAGGEFPWGAYRAALADVLTTELNSLPDGEVSALGPEYDNSTNRDQLADLVLDLASANVPIAGAFVTLYVVPSIDGTNYPTWTAGAVANYHGQYARGRFLVKLANATHKVTAEGVRLPPCKCKFAVRNGLFVAFASSANTVKMRAYNEAYT